MDGSQKEEVTLISFRKKGVPKKGGSNPGGNYVPRPPPPPKKKKYIYIYIYKFSFLVS